MDVMAQKISRDDFMTAVEAGIDPIRLYLYYKKTFQRENSWCLLHETYLISAVEAAMEHFRRSEMTNLAAFVKTIAMRGHVDGLSWYGVLVCDVLTISEERLCKETANSDRLFT